MFYIFIQSEVNKIFDIKFFNGNLESKSQVSKYLVFSTSLHILPIYYSRFLSFLCHFMDNYFFL